ncbi:MAG TPA: hypothetical protein VNI78_01670, partial [Vicinamibacterales bacterium]|nr:hypothetical protein [Vicinamibacterales bacterium]
FFNQLVGGPANGYRFLDDSNLGWGQNLKPLKAWMDANGVDHINLAYFGQADPAYYGIDCTHLPGAPSFAIDRVARPRLPGYVALSAAIVNGVYAPPSWRLFYRPFRDLQPVAVIGHAIRVYWVDEWPDAIGENVPGAEPDAHRELADALLFGLRWPEQAVRHYDEYIRTRPDDVDGLANYGLALAASGRIGDSMATLERALHIAPTHRMAHEYLRRVEAALGKAGVK